MPLANNEISNVLLPGALKIHKNVVDAPADSKTPFGFTLKLQAPDGLPLTGSFEWEVTEEVVQDGSASVVQKNKGTYELTSDYPGEVNFMLANKEAITITGLPAGARYSVEEQEYPAYATNYAPVQTGTIPSDEVETITVTNRYKTGILRLTKNVSGPSADRNRLFEFTLTLRQGAGSDAAPVSGVFSVASAAIGEADAPGYTALKFDENGTAKVSLSAGQRIGVLGLPAGSVCTIDEVPVEGYVTKISAGKHIVEESESAADHETIEGTNIAVRIEDGHRHDIDFNNISTPDVGTLLVTKTVSCTNVDPDMRFTFDIYAEDANGDPLVGTFDATVGITGSEQAQTSTLDFDMRGKASFELGHRGYMQA